VLEKWENEGRNFDFKPISLLFLSGKTVEITTIFKRLATQNEGLSTKDWRVFHKWVPSPKGFMLQPLNLFIEKEATKTTYRQIL
jgi:hypothetical protein